MRTDSKKRTYTIEKREIGSKGWDFAEVALEDSTADEAIQFAARVLDRPEVYSVRVSEFMSHHSHIYMPQFDS